MEISRICICGAGTMGRGIAQVSAGAGISTALFDTNSEVLEKSQLALKKDLESLVEKNKILPDQAREILEKIFFTGDPGQCQADLVIEAIVENLDAKIALFAQLADINPTETIFASNTSSLSVTTIAGNISSPGRLIGMHFFNPAPIMKLVEIVTTPHTAPDLVSSIADLVRKFKKTPVVCRDSPGFIVNRVARPFYIESLRIMEEQGLEPAVIDRLMEASGFRMGPFRLMDLIGNDVNFAVSESVYEQLGRPERLRPSKIQKEKVDHGELGRKTGKGYYSY